MRDMGVFYVIRLFEGGTQIKNTFFEDVLDFQEVIVPDFASAFILMHIQKPVQNFHRSLCSCMIKGLFQGVDKRNW